MKRRLAVLLLGAVMAGLLFGCGEGPEKITQAQSAKDAMNTAASIYLTGDLEAVNQKTDILADGKVAGRMEESGFFNTRWTVTAGDGTWFYMKIVTDEPINEDTEEYVSGNTFGFYDEADNCLGYAQKRGFRGDTGSGYDYYFMDAEQNLKDYRMEETGEYFTDMEGNVIARADSAMDFTGRTCHIQIDMEKGSDARIDFMDKLPMYYEQLDELKFWHSN